MDYIRDHIYTLFYDECFVNTSLSLDLYVGSAVKRSFHETSVKNLREIYCINDN